MSDAVLTSEAPVRTELGSDKAGWPYAPHVIVFFSSMCVMIVEVVAGRLIARHLGSSLYTWTSIIGVVLAGITIGNYVGGLMADRWKPSRFLGWLFTAASVFCLLTLLLNDFAAGISLFGSLSWPTRILLNVLLIFLAPALVMGAISPVAAKMALERSTTVGATLGSVSAWGTAGSIIGTFLTGFWLIAALGSRGVVLAVVVGMSLIGGILGPHRIVQGLWVAIAVGCCVMNFSGDYNPDRVKDNTVFIEDSKYQLVKVKEETEPDRETGEPRVLRVLVLDYLVHGYVDEKDPTYLHYSYEHLYRDVAKRYMEGKSKVSAFYIGGGAYTFPRWVEHQWPGSRNVVAEIDPIVIEANHAALGLARNTSIESIPMDGRNAVDSLKSTDMFDMVYGDAFHDFSVPFHLTTVEYARKVKAHMNPDGVYLVNVIDSWDSALMVGSFANTLKLVFKNVNVYVTTKTGVASGRETFVVAASDKAIEISDWLPGHDGPFPGSVLTPKDMKELAAKCNDRVLTDDDAPVENLLLPVVSARKPKS